MYLAGLPSFEDPRFDFEITRVLEDPEFDRQPFEAILDEDDDEHAVRALYVLVTRMARDYDYEELRTIVRSRHQRFANNPATRSIFDRIRARMLSESSDADEKRQALGLCRELMKRAPERPGDMQMLGRIVADLAELGEASETELCEAEKALHRAIACDPTIAKYHATLGRISGFRGRFEDGHRLIQKAIEMEPSTGPDHLARIASYQDHRVTVRLEAGLDELRKLQDEFQRQTERAEQRVDQLRGQLMQLLGLLAAVVAFIFTGVQVATQLELDDAVALMASIIGGLVAVFAAYAMLLLREWSWKALAMLVGGLLLLGFVWIAS